VAIAGNQFVLDDGQVISPGRTAEISLNGKAAGFGDLQPNDEVSVRYNVETNEVREILASRRIATVAQRVTIDSIETDVTRPLRAGDTIAVHDARNARCGRDVRYRLRCGESSDATASARSVRRKLRHPARCEL